MAYSKRQYRPVRQRGFGLTECMIAAFILMAGALATYQATRLWHQKTVHLTMVNNLHVLNDELAIYLQPAFQHASAQQQEAIFAMPQNSADILATQLSSQVHQALTDFSQSVSISATTLSNETVGATNTLQLSPAPANSTLAPDLIMYEVNVNQSAYQQNIDAQLSIGVIRPDGLAYPDAFVFNNDHAF